MVQATLGSYSTPDTRWTASIPAGLRARLLPFLVAVRSIYHLWSWTARVSLTNHKHEKASEFSCVSVFLKWSCVIYVILSL
jgi:hypothetical protein